MSGADVSSIIYLLLLACAVVLVRNSCVYRARIAILKTKTPNDPYAGNKLHDLLPEYEAMLWHPNYWMKWTEADWREYLSRQPGGTS